MAEREFDLPENVRLEDVSIIEHTGKFGDVPQDGCVFQCFDVSGAGCEPFRSRLGWSEVFESIDEALEVIKSEHPPTIDQETGIYNHKVRIMFRSQPKFREL